MSKNKGQAITKSLFLHSGRGGTQVCSTTFAMAVWFVWACIVCLFSWWFSFYGLNDYTSSTNTVVMVNPPDSFIEYREEAETSRQLIFYEEWDAAFDFMKMSDFMHDHAAGVVIFFPEDFDDTLKRGEDSSILTYYRTATLDYMYIRDDFVDEYLEDYRVFLADRYNLENAGDSWEVVRDDIPTNNGEPWAVLFGRSMGRNFIPILLFIVLLYAAMSSGTEAISGQKERGTFSRILLSPVSRKDIVQAFTNGVFLSSAIPSIVVIILTWLIPLYRHPASFIPILLLTISLALFISALTVMISVMNDTVTSAQTAFLPIFFILVTIAVTCINGDEDTGEFYYFIPVYGHFYGLGDGFNGQPHILASIVCSAVTAALAFAITKISSKLLMSEKFTVLTTSSEEEEIAREPSAFEKTVDSIIGLFDAVLYPLMVLSIFQLLAMIPVAVAYMRDPAYSDFIADLANVSGVADIIERTMTILGIFMNDAKFLALMAVAYILMILTYIRRAKGAANIGLVKEKMPKFYCLGIVLGITLMSLVFALLVVTGKTTVEGFGLPSGSILTFIFSLLMWVPQGAAEEVMFRGFMMPKIKSIFGKHGSVFAIVISSILFSVFHCFNGGFSIVALINIFLLAVFFALIYEKTGSIVITCAAHTMWNMFQGNIYGLSVSGNASVPALLTTNYTGSSFGPEGTLEATAVIIAALAVMAVITLCRKRPSPKAS